MLNFRPIKSAEPVGEGNRFVADAGVEMANDQCHHCRYWTHGTLSCQAFPEGIPLGFLTGELDHTKPYPGDNGVRYEPV